MRKRKLFSSRITSSLLLGLPFVCSYITIRNLPVTPCDFLHEETYNEEGELDYCGSDDTGFVDLSIRKWPMNIDFRALDTPVIGNVCKFEFKIEKSDGSPLTSEDVALSHTQKIHLLVVDETLRDYHHIHPVADSLFDGLWHFSLTPKLSGKYSVYLDFIPLKSPRRVLLSSSFFVPGERSTFLERKENLSFSYRNLEFKLEKNSSDSYSNQIQLTLTAKNEIGEDIDFHPVMGAFAHMVAFDPNLDGFAHLHPESVELPSSLNPTFNGPLSFGFAPPSNGLFRLWAQVKVSNSEEVFLPFDLDTSS